MHGRMIFKSHGVHTLPGEHAVLDLFMVFFRGDFSFYRALIGSCGYPSFRDIGHFWLEQVLGTRYGRQKLHSTHHARRRHCFNMGSDVATRGSAHHSRN